MLRFALVCLVIAVIAGLSGFNIVSGMAWDGAVWIFFIFLALAVLSYLYGSQGERATNRR